MELGFDFLFLQWKSISCTFISIKLYWQARVNSKSLERIYKLKYLTSFRHTDSLKLN